MGISREEFDGIVEDPDVVIQSKIWRVREFLSTNPDEAFSAREIAEACGLLMNYVYMYSKQMIKKGQATRKIKLILNDKNEPIDSLYYFAWNLDYDPDNPPTMTPEDDAKIITEELQE